MKKVDIVIPVYNEEEGLAASLYHLLSWVDVHPLHEWKIVVANNASTDNTINIAHDFEKKFPGQIYVINIPTKGRGIALRKSWTRSEADICVFMDADLSTKLRHLPEIIDAIIIEGYDVCCGSRWLKESVVKRTLFRGIMSWTYNLILKLMLGFKINDAQCGFKAVKTTVAKKILPYVENNDWFFDSEFLIIAQKNNLRIKEIPIEWVDNAQSTVSVIKTIKQFLKEILRIRVNGVPKVTL